MERFSVERDGFCGFLHEPASGADRFVGKAIVVLGGSEGNENIPHNLGARFAEEGLRARPPVGGGAPNLQACEPHHGVSGNWRAQALPRGARASTRVRRKPLGRVQENARIPREVVERMARILRWSLRRIRRRWGLDGNRSFEPEVGLRLEIGENSTCIAGRSPTAPERIASSSGNDRKHHPNCRDVFLSFDQNDTLIASMGQQAVQWALLLENACSA